MVQTDRQRQHDLHHTEIEDLLDDARFTSGQFGGGGGCFFVPAVAATAWISYSMWESHVHAECHCRFCFLKTFRTVLYFAQELQRAVTRKGSDVEAGIVVC